MKNKETPISEYFRVSLSVPKKQDAYLEGLSSDIKEQGGFKLPKTLIIRAMIRLMMKTKPDLAGIKNEDELLKRFIKAVKKL